MNADEQRALRLLNEARFDHEQPRLKSHWLMCAYAHWHARKMAKGNHLFHGDPGVYLRARGVAFIDAAYGENVGATGGDIEDLHHAFLISKTHRANVLAFRWRRVGIGVYRLNGGVWETQVFR